MLYEIINSIVYVVLAYIFLETFTHPKKHMEKYRIVVLALWTISGVAMSFMFPDNLIARIIISVFINIMVSIVVFDNTSVIKNISLAILFYILAIGCDLLIVSIQKQIDSDLRINLIMQESISIYMGAISQLLQAFIVFTINKLFSSSKDTQIESNLWIFYLVFPIYSLVLIVLIGYSFDGPINSLQANAYTFFSLSILIINLFVYWFIKQELLRTLKLQKNEMEISHAQEIKELYEQITKERDILGKREHEYKSTITALYGLAIEKQFDDVQRILAEQNTDLLNMSNIIDTGNRLISTIINAKYAEAQDKGISVRLMIDNLSNVMINDKSCIIILTNILNNAIEAAEKCLEDKRLIMIKAFTDSNNFIFCVRNSSSDKNNDLKSRKKDIVSHGYGIKNISEEVKAIGGKCYFENEGSFFSALVVVPL